jgi:hypothetical protein
MVLLPIILFVTADICKKVQIRLKCIRTIRKPDMILIYGESNKNASAVGIYADNKDFPENSSFFHNFISLSE